MGRGRRSLVSILFLREYKIMCTDNCAEHTLLVTAGGVEVLTARLPTSPGGPVAYPVAE